MSILAELHTFQRIVGERTQDLPWTQPDEISHASGGFATKIRHTFFSNTQVTSFTQEVENFFPVADLPCNPGRARLANQGVKKPRCRLISIGGGLLFRSLGEFPLFDYTLPCSASHQHLPGADDHAKNQRNRYGSG